MEIIHLVLGKANPDRLNGVNKVVYQLATEQTNANLNVSLWGITKNLTHNYAERAFKTLLFKSCLNPFGIDKELKNAIINKKNAVFHLHGGWIPVYYSLAKFFKKYDVKFIITPHGAYNEIAMKRNNIVKKIYFQLCEKKILKNAKQIHSIGKSEVDGLQKIYANQKSTLLPYGFYQNTNNTELTKNSDFTIGFVGRLDVYTKGLDLLLKSFLTFQKNNPTSKLWIIGDGKGKLYIEKFVAENKLTNVVLWGKKFGLDKDNLISQMHVFAHPSRNEGLPTSVLEAASFGIPSIVSYATNVADFIKSYQCGISIEDNNQLELTNALNSLKTTYENHAHHGFSENCKQMLKNEFSWNVLVHKYSKLYGV